MRNVALLHGLGADRRAFQRFARLLPDGWRVECLDLLGHGSAEKPAHGYSMADHGRYIAEVVRTTFQTASDVIIVGHSYGAGVGTATAALDPDLVQSLVLLDPIDNPGLRTMEAQGVPAPLVDPLSSTMHPDRPSGPAAGGSRGSGTAQMMEARRTGTLAQTVDRLFASESAPLRAWIVQTWSAMSLGVIDEFDPDWMRLAPQVACPVTIIHGDAELGGGGPGPGSYFACPTMVRIAGAGHYLHATHAREVAAQVAMAIEGSPA